MSDTAFKRMTLFIKEAGSGTEGSAAKGLGITTKKRHFRLGFRV